MTWVLHTAAQAAGNNLSAPHATFTLTAGAAVAVGELINVAITFGQLSNVPASSVITDNLGNTYTNRTRTTDATNQQVVETWRCIVTVAGTPTIQSQYNPTPGTTQAQNTVMSIDPFTGSDAASANDGQNAQLQNAPGTGTDAVSSGTITTATNGSLVYGACIESSTGTDPGSIGTGFTLAQSNPGGGLVLKTEWKTQVTAGATAATFTTASGAGAFLTAGHAITPAASVLTPLVGQACL